jgi:hypothetical protein
MLPDHFDHLKWSRDAPENCVERDEIALVIFASSSLTLARNASAPAAAA